jgi:type II secretory pathway pseudopilin PulG
MKHPCDKCGSERGASLIEAVIAIGVLAVAIPIVFGALAEAGKCGLASQAETRSTWMIPACMDEIRASRAACPQYFTATMIGQTFPPTSEVWALAFSAEGKPIGKISQVLYDRGTRVIDGHSVRYIASLVSSTAASKGEPTPLLRVHIALEYPAMAPVEKRRKLDFYTLIP